jgi:hypothetical protein
MATRPPQPRRPGPQGLAPRPRHPRPSAPQESIGARALTPWRTLCHRTGSLPEPHANDAACTLTCRSGPSRPPSFTSLRRSPPCAPYKSRRMVPSRARISPHFLLACASRAIAAITTAAMSYPSRSLLEPANPSCAFPRTHWSLHRRLLSRFHHSFTGAGTLAATAVWLRRAGSPATPPSRPSVGIEPR